MTTTSQTAGTPQANYGPPGASTNPQQKAPDGPYYSANFPLLGAVTAICCNKVEREKFWEDKEYDMSAPVAFCKERYGLSEPHIRLLLAPEASSVRPCFPNEQEAELVAAALIAELTGKKQSTTPKTSQPFDPTLEARYPIVAALYRAYELGTGQPPPNWQQGLVTEFKDGAKNKDDVW
jgi:hypothetical protein